MTEELVRTAPDARALLARVRLARRRRLVLVTVGLATAVLVLVGVSLTTGAFAIAPADLLATIFGQGEPSSNFVVWRLRIPRLLLGVLAGTAFALAGALFQTLLRNPLASPDILGISGGASAAAAFGILVLGVSGLAVSALALIGGITVALAIYGLAWQRGVAGYRFVLIGVAFAFLAQAVIGYLLSRGDVRDAQQALVWTVGGLGNAGWEELAVLAGALAVLIPLIIGTLARLRVMQLGDASASGLGVRVEPTRLVVLLIAVALAAIATAMTGPIAFVAFVSAPIARRLVGAGSLALVPSALTGCAIVLGADLVAGLLVPTAQVPVGIVTAMIGAPYLLWLMTTRSERFRG